MLSVKVDIICCNNETKYILSFFGFNITYYALMPLKEQSLNLAVTLSDKSGYFSLLFQTKIETQRETPTAVEPTGHVIPTELTDRGSRFFEFFEVFVDNLCIGFYLTTLAVSATYERNN